MTVYGTSAEHVFLEAPEAGSWERYAGDTPADESLPPERQYHVPGKVVTALAAAALAVSIPGYMVGMYELHTHLGHHAAEQGTVHAPSQPAVK